MRETNQTNPYHGGSKRGSQLKAGKSQTDTKTTATVVEKMQKQYVPPKVCLPTLCSPENGQTYPLVLNFYEHQWEVNENHSPLVRIIALSLPVAKKIVKWTQRHRHRRRERERETERERERGRGRRRERQTDRQRDGQRGGRQADRQTNIFQ